MSVKSKFIIFIILWGIICYEILFNASLHKWMFLFLKLHPAITPFILIVTQLFLASFMLPCSPLAVFAGMFWGIKLGLIYSTLATIISSIWCFFLSRYLHKNWFKKETSLSLILKAQELIKKYNWKASAIAHMNPIFPGSSLGYFFGSSDIKLFYYSLGAILGSIPLQVIMVGLGHITYLSLNNYMNIVFFAALLIIISIFCIYKFFGTRIKNVIN